MFVNNELIGEVVLATLSSVSIEADTSRVVIKASIVLGEVVVSS